MTQRQKIKYFQSDEGGGATEAQGGLLFSLSCDHELVRDLVRELQIPIPYKFWRRLSHRPHNFMCSY